MPAHTIQHYVTKQTTSQNAGALLRNQAELCNPALADRTAVESLLFDAFISAAYREDPPGRWKAQDAERWLVFLARYLEHGIGSPDLGWWQLPLFPPGLMKVYELVHGPGPGHAQSWMGERTPVPIDSVASPMTSLRKERRWAIHMGLIVGIFTGIGAWVMAEIMNAATGTAAAVVGVVLGVVLGVGAFSQTSWPWYEIARIWFALRHRLPWRLMGFLADAHKRGVLRQAGAFHQFRHIELQHHLATRPSSELASGD